MSGISQLYVQSDIGITLNTLIVLISIFGPIATIVGFFIVYKVMRRIESSKKYQEVSSENVDKMIEEMQNPMELKVYRSGKISNGLIKKAWIKIENNAESAETSAFLLGTAMVITVLIIGARTNFITSTNALSINYNTSIILQKSNPIRFSWKVTIPSLSRIDYNRRGFKMCDFYGRIYDCTTMRLNGSSNVNVTSTIIAITTDSSLCFEKPRFKINLQDLSLDAAGTEACYSAFIACSEDYCFIGLNNYRAFNNVTDERLAKRQLVSLNYYGPTDQICIWWFPNCDAIISGSVLRSIGTTIPSLVSNMDLLKDSLISIVSNQNNISSNLVNSIANLNKQIKISVDSNDNYGSSLASLIAANREESVYGDWKSIVRNHDIEVLNYDYESEIVRSNNLNDAFEANYKVFEYINNRTGIKIEDIQKFGRFVNYKIKDKQEISVNWIGPSNVKYIDAQISYKPSYAVCNTFSCRIQNAAFSITDLSNKVIFNALDSSSYECIMNGKCISNTILTYSNEINKNSMSVSAIIEDSTIESTYVGTTNNFFLIDDQTGKISIVHSLINLYYKDMFGKNVQINGGSIAMIIKGISAIDIYSDALFKNKVATIEASYDITNVESINVGVIDKNKAAAYVLTASNTFLETSQLSVLPSTSSNDIEKLQSIVYGNLESINDTIEQNNNVISKLVSEYKQIQANMFVENPDSSLKDTATAGLVLAIFAFILSIAISIVLLIVFYLYKYKSKLFKKIFGESAGADSFLIDDGPSKEDFAEINAPLLVVYKDGKSRVFSSHVFYTFYKIANLRFIPKWEAVCFIPLEQFITGTESEMMKLRTSLAEEVFKKNALSQRYKYKEQMQSKRATEETSFNYDNIITKPGKFESIIANESEEVGMPINKQMKTRI